MIEIDARTLARRLDVSRTILCPILERYPSRKVKVRQSTVAAYSGSIRPKIVKRLYSLTEEQMASVEAEVAARKSPKKVA